MGQYGAGQTGGYEIWQVDTLPGWWFYVRILSYGLGAVLLALAALGCLRRLIMAVQDDTGMSVVLLSFPMVYFGLMGSTRHYFARYALPLVPFSALFAAEAVVASGRWVHARHQSLGWVLITGLAIVAVAQPFASTVRHDALLTRTDTRTLARHWIESNIPAGSRIAVDWRTHGPPLATGETGRPESDTIFDVTAVGGSGLSDHALDWYREQAFDYLIATSFIYEIPLVDEEQDQQRRAFYTSLDRELQLMYEIRPSRDGTEPPFVFDEIYGPIVGLSQRQRPGPTLKIYRVDGS